MLHGSRLSFHGRLRPQLVPAQRSAVGPCRLESQKADGRSNPSVPCHRKGEKTRRRKKEAKISAGEECCNTLGHADVILAGLTFASVSRFNDGDLVVAQ